jgi:hypothetical protein
MRGAPRGWKLNYPQDTSPVVIIVGSHSNKSLIVFPPGYAPCICGRDKHWDQSYRGTTDAFICCNLKMKDTGAACRPSKDSCLFIQTERTVPAAL